MNRFVQHPTGVLWLQEAQTSHSTQCYCYKYLQPGILATDAVLSVPAAALPAQLLNLSNSWGVYNLWPIRMHGSPETTEMVGGK